MNFSSPGVLTLQCAFPASLDTQWNIICTVHYSAQPENDAQSFDRGVLVVDGGCGSDILDTLQVSSLEGSQESVDEAPSESSSGIDANA